MRLASTAGLAPENAPAEQCEASVTELGEDLLAAGAGLGQRLATDVVNGDIKFYQHGTARFAIAQVEVNGFSELEQRLGDLRAALEDLREREGLTFALLLVTDVVRGTSRLVTAGPHRLLDQLPYPRRADGTLEARGVVSRKKQLLPTVLAAAEDVQ